MRRPSQFSAKATICIDTSLIGQKFRTAGILVTSLVSP